MAPYFRGIDMYNEAADCKGRVSEKWKAYNSSDGPSRRLHQNNKKMRFGIYAT